MKKEFTRFKEVTVGIIFLKKFTLRQDCSKMLVQLIAAVPFGIAAVLSDIIIAVALCVLLGSNRSSFDDTNSMINKLIVFAINRCILTSCVLLLTL
jgi:Family of unknown function (DUF6534)